MCRICQDNDDPRLITPCRCTSQVHRRCLDNWRCQSDEAFRKCPTCQFEYLVDVKPDASHEKERRELARRLTWDTILFLVFLALVSTLLGLCVVSLCDPERTHPFCQSADPLVWTCVGLVVIFCFIGFVAMIFAPGGFITSPQMNRYELFFFACVGFIVTVFMTMDTISNKLRGHMAGRKRQVRVHEVVVRDLSQII